jgi:hypothetical protein
VEEFDLAVGKEGIHPEEEFIEEIYSQLWIVPKPEVRVQESPGLNGGGLVWVRNDLVRDRKVILADCFPVSKSHRFEGTLKKIQLATQIWEGGSRSSYAEIVKRFPMAEGGRWVWQEDKPRAAQRGCGQRGRPPWRPPRQQSHPFPHLQMQPQWHFQGQPQVQKPGPGAPQQAMMQQTQQRQRAGTS